MNFTIYLVFDKNCREAFELYRTVFGGEFTEFLTYGEGPPEMNVLEGDRDLVMHMSLPIGSNVLMGCDIDSQTPPLIPGNNFAVSVSPDSREEADRLFSELSEGGAAVMPMADMFWGGYFGMCVDKFGVSWQINYGPPAD